MEKGRNLRTLVLPFLGHPVRESAKHLLAVLELLMRLLKGLAPEEHLPCKEKRQDEDRDRPEPEPFVELGQEEAK